MTALKIQGGVANQPNIPSVQFGWGRNDGWFEARPVVEGEHVIDSDVMEYYIVNDWHISNFTQGVFGRVYRIDVEVLPRLQSDTFPNIELLTSEGLEPIPNNPLGFRTKQSGGGITDIVRLTTPQRTLDIPLTGVIRTTGTLSNFDSFVENPAYLSYHCENEVNSRIQGATTAMLPIFLNYTQSNSSGIYTRNPDCWIYNLSQVATCISPWNSNAANRKAGTALTPRHIGLAAHYEYPVGTQVRFVTADNQTITKTVIGRKRHPEYAPYFPDITLYLLDSDLPSSITPCKVLPSNWSEYLPNDPRNIATLCLDQEEKALVTDLNSLTSTFANFRFPDQPYEQVLYEGKVVGDSGNPAFLIINDQLVCLTFWTFGGAGSGTFLTPQIGAMNQMIQDLDTAAGINTGYTIQTVDLSGFTNFNE
jgi:hypothetical protein